MSRSAKRARASTRLRGIGSSIGALSQDDTPSARRPIVSSASPSVRTLPSSYIPSMTTLCARVFVSSLRAMYDEQRELRKSHLKWLKLLPDSIISGIFVIMTTQVPTLLTPAFISHYFIRGQSFSLSSDVTQVTRQTIAALPRTSHTLRDLELTGFDKFPDNVFSSVLSHLGNLRSLNLRGCGKVGVGTAEVVGRTCSELVRVNFSQTSVTPLSMNGILIRCKKLEIVKIIDSLYWTDANFAKLLVSLESQKGKHFTLPRIQTLNLSQTSLSDTSIQPLLRACPNLRRFSVSFTRVRHPRGLLAVPSLEKLALTSTALLGPDLLSLLKRLPELRVLHIGALGGGSATSARVDNSSAMTLSDALLLDLTSAMESMVNLDNVVLAGNTKLGMTGRKGKGALADFITRVGRRCKKLNLAFIKCLKSEDLTGLMDEDGSLGDARLEVLVLDNTDIGDEATQYLSTCSMLEKLSLKGTKFTSAGLFPIIDACPKLQQLDLTGCRGVNTADRRRFFEVWEEEWN